MTQNKTMAKFAKTQTRKKKKSPISKENANKILRAYIALYNAFLLQNLMANKTLGASSHNALQLLKAKIATMDKNNPVTKLLKRIHKYHSKKITKLIMTNKHRDSRATIRPDDRKKLTTYIAKRFNEANKTLNTMSAMYKPKTVAMAPATRAPQMVAATVRVENKQPVAKKQKMVLQLWLRRHQQQRAA